MKHAIYDIAPMKAVHVGLECDDDHDVHCEEEGPCVVIEHERKEREEKMATTNVAGSQ